MKIALEISNIGQGQIDPTGKTGLYRVATSLSKAMLDRNKIELFFTLLELPHAIELTKKYFLSQNHSIHCLFENKKFEKILYRMMTSSPQFKYKYGLMLYIASFLQLPKKKYLPEDVDIFHSLYFPLPKNICNNNQIRFITIHDIIQVMLPQYCTGFQTRRINNVIRNIDINKDWITAVSECSKKDICKYSGISKERVFVTPLAASKKSYYPFIDINQMANIKQQFNVPEGEYFLSLSTIEPRKNLLHTIRCFKKILSEPGLSHLNFILVGKRGWKTDHLYKEIYSDPILKTHVVFTGFIPDEYLSAIYSGALAFIYPSLYEGFGLPPLEAMQCGTPVITSNTSSLPEVVGDAGIMVDPKDEDALCQAMIDIVKNNKLRTDLSKKGIERSKMFSWEKCADETIKAYRFALDHKN